MRIELAGDLRTALTHFALVGLASILAEQGREKIRVWWQDGSKAIPTVEWQGGSADKALHDHAKRHSHHESWVQASSPGGKSGLFSPRQSFPADSAGWTEFMNLRSAELKKHLTELDWRMMGGLGEPGHWLFIDNKSRPDAAASRWEMIPRFRGDEFIGKRLAPLARIIASREPSAIQSGLIGDTLVDDLGGEGPSRTGTGLCPPQPVDSAIAWCALWGLSCFPVVPRPASISATPGASPALRTQPAFMTLPIWETPVTVALWREVMTSAALHALSSALSGQNSTAWDGAETAVEALVRAGVLALLHCPVHHTDNRSAPERQILEGNVVILDDLLGSAR
jgi:CRISPR-associated protein Csb3